MLRASEGIELHTVDGTRVHLPLYLNRIKRGYIILHICFKSQTLFVLSVLVIRETDPTGNTGSRRFCMLVCPQLLCFACSGIHWSVMLLPLIRPLIKCILTSFEWMNYIELRYANFIENTELSTGRSWWGLPLYVKHAWKYLNTRGSLCSEFWK